jgi:hypothetical protein
MVDFTELERIEQTQSTEKSPYDILMELFKTENGHIDFKTQLTTKQINSLTRLEFISKYCSMEKTLGRVCLKFKRLMVSEERKGRTEFINALKNEMVQEQMRTFEQMRQALGMQSGGEIIKR